MKKKKIVYLYVVAQLVEVKNKRSRLYITQQSSIMTPPTSGREMKGPGRYKLYFDATGGRMRSDASQILLKFSLQISSFIFFSETSVLYIKGFRRLTDYLYHGSSYMESFFLHTCMRPHCIRICPYVMVMFQAII